MFVDAMTGAVTNDGSHVYDGRGFGVGAGLAQVNYQPSMKRPFIKNGQRCVLVDNGWKKDKATGQTVKDWKTVRIDDLRRQGLDDPTWNAATLPKDSWIRLDQAVVMATRKRLNAWSDLMASVPVGGFNGMSTMTYEYQAMTDPGEAVVDMDALTPGRTDRPLFNLRSIPLPITHSDFWFSRREIAVSRNSGKPLDTTMAEAAGRRVAETIEQTTIGTVTGMTYGPTSVTDTRYSGTSAVYGYTNFPSRVTKTDLTTPTGSNPEAVVADILEMVETMQTNGFYGPYVLYHSTGYSRYLNDDYFRTGGTSAVRTLRERIMEIDGISKISRLDYLTSGYQLILVQMDSEVVQAINGLDITTVQWESQGGERINFKVMAIGVPLLKTPYNGVSGIQHGTTS